MGPKTWFAQRPMLGKNFYRKALFRHVSPSFVDALQMEPSTEPISVEECDKQHRRHIEQVKEHVPHLHCYELESDAQCPDCMFIEDTSVVINQTVILTQPGDPTRRPEISPVLRFWEAQQADKEAIIQNVISMATHPVSEEASPALLDG